MKTEKELNSDIRKITVIIHEDYPEISKNIVEMPKTIYNTDNSEITIKNLKNYYNLLMILIKNDIKLNLVLQK